MSTRENVRLIARASFLCIISLLCSNSEPGKVWEILDSRQPKIRNCVKEQFAGE